MNYTELYNKVKQAGVIVYVVTRITVDDVIQVEAKKGDFLARISAIIRDGQGDLETNAWVDTTGNVVID